jgi:capsular exopolysaccharide synthesis family protein
MKVEIDVQKGSIMQQNEDRIGYRILQQEIATNKRFHASLTNKFKETEISAANEINNIVLKERAIGASRTGPDRSNWILLSFLISLGGGFGLAIIREFLDQTIKSIDDVDRVAKLPSLGIIPALGAGPGTRRKLLGTGSSSPGDLSDELITSVQVQSSAAEAYRHLRTSILLSSAGHPSKLLLVTSSQPREGKTTTAVNTAISLAQTGASVVIVDCDMRKPRVHKLLNVDDEMGVSLYLSGQNENLDELIQTHQIPNLSVLGCGPIPPNPAELLGSTQMRKLLGALLQQFDHVVIDSPPVISFADPVILSTMVDGVILVVRGGFTSRGIMLRSRQILSDVGAKIYGVVLNDADMRSNEAYYYKYSTYYYYNEGKRRGRKQREPVADADGIED